MWGGVDVQYSQRDLSIFTLDSSTIQQIWLNISSSSLNPPRTFCNIVTGMKMEIRIFFCKWIIIDCNLFRVNLKSLSMPGVLLIAFSWRWKQFSHNSSYQVFANNWNERSESSSFPHTQSSKCYVKSSATLARWKSNRSQRDWCKIDENEKCVILLPRERRGKYLWIFEEKWTFREESFNFISSRELARRRRWK